MFYIEPIGGLCNRMRAINASYYLAKELKQKLVIVWRCNVGMTIPMQALFSVKNTRVIVVYNSSDTIWGGVKDQINNKIWSMLLKKCDVHIDEEEAAKMSHPYPPLQDIVNKMSKYKNIWLTTGEEIIRTNGVDIFSPSKCVIKQVKKLSESLSFTSGKVIGVHIRRTDNVQSIENSPLELFIEKMRQKSISDKCRFYLATDSHDTEIEMRKAFGDAVITYEGKDFSRDTFKGQIDAYVELLMLSRCEEIWGSYFSSYSEMASKLVGKELYTIKI